MSCFKRSQVAAVSFFFRSRMLLFEKSSHFPPARSCSSDRVRAFLVFSSSSPSTSREFSMLLLMATALWSPAPLLLNWSQLLHPRKLSWLVLFSRTVSSATQPSARSGYQLRQVTPPQSPSRPGKAIGARETLPVSLFPASPARRPF